MIVAPLWVTLLTKLTELTKVNSGQEFFCGLPTIILGRKQA